MPLFGAGGLLENGGGAHPSEDEYTFVKLDCEGAELELLKGFEPGAWRKVTRLVLEYSFTKDRQMASFLECVRRLEGEGFDVWWEGKDAWERDLTEWPWHVDALVFAAR